MQQRALAVDAEDAKRKFQVCLCCNHHARLRIFLNLDGAPLTGFDLSLLCAAPTTLLPGLVTCILIIGTC